MTSPTRRLATLLPVLAVLLALCCVGAALAAPPPAKGGKAEPPRARKEAPHYAVEVLDAAARTGKEQQAELRIEGRGAYHVNVDYPTRIKLSAAPGVQLKAAAVSKSDALQLTKQVGRFPVRYTPGKPGQAELTAEVRFSVCDDKQCDLATETLSWSVMAE